MAPPPGSRLVLLGTAEVARLCGVSESAIKRWSDDGTLTCLRTAGGHRRFLPRDIHHFLTSRQYEIPLELASRLESREPDPEGVALYALNQEYDRVRDRVLERSLRPMPGALESILRTLSGHGIPLTTIYHRVICPCLRKVGTLWKDGTLSLVRVHVALAEMEEALARHQGRLAAAPPTGRRVLVATLAPDQHTLPVRLAANLLEVEGWTVAAARGPSPAPVLADHLHRERPDLLCLAVTVVPDVEGFLVETGRVVEAAQEAGTQVILGGRALTRLPVPCPADRVLRNLPALVEAVQEL